jgi:uncharacterized protein (TIGR02118 family)
MLSLSSPSPPGASHLPTIGGLTGQLACMHSGARFATGLPWATVLQAASASSARSAGGASAIADHGNPPSGVVKLPMIKMVFLLVKPQSMSDGSFHQYWLEKHGPLVRSLANDMRAKRYIQSHLMPSATVQAAAEIRDLKPNPYQGFAEVWWDSEEDMAAAFATAAGAEAGGKLLEDEQKFLDDRTLILMTQEYLIFDRA